MTPACLEEYINMFLLDELRTDIDRHTGNYILYKNPEDKLWQGIIPFDLENIKILNSYIHSKKDFESFIYEYYATMTPLYYQDSDYYLNRINHLRTAYADGVLSEGNIATIKTALNYDLPSQISDTCNNPYLKRYRKSTYDTYSRLWDFNRQTIGKELGL